MRNIFEYQKACYTMVLYIAGTSSFSFHSDTVVNVKIALIDVKNVTHIHVSTNDVTPKFKFSQCYHF